MDLSHHYQYTWGMFHIRGCWINIVSFFLFFLELLYEIGLDNIMHAYRKPWWCPVLPYECSKQNLWNNGPPRKSPSGGSQLPNCVWLAKRWGRGKTWLHHNILWWWNELCRKYSSGLRSGPMRKPCAFFCIVMGIFMF